MLPDLLVLRCLCFVGVAQRNNKPFFVVRCLYHLGRIAHWNYITYPKLLQNKSRFKGRGACWCTCRNVQRSRKFLASCFATGRKKKKICRKTLSNLHRECLVHCVVLFGKNKTDVWFIHTALMNWVLKYCLRTAQQNTGLRKSLRDSENLFICLSFSFTTLI